VLLCNGKKDRHALGLDRGRRLGLRLGLGLRLRLRLRLQHLLLFLLRLLLHLLRSNIVVLAFDIFPRFVSVEPKRWC